VEYVAELRDLPILRDGFCFADAASPGLDVAGEEGVSVDPDETSVDFRI